MQIIVISDRLAKAKSISLSLRHVLGSLALTLAVVLGLTAALYWLSLRFAADLRLPMLHRLVLAAQKSEHDRTREFMQQNLNAMAVKIGEMQAQLTRLDALGERLSSLAGIKSSDLHLGSPVGLGGATSVMPLQDLSLRDLEAQLAALGRNMDNRADVYGVLDSQLRDLIVRRKVMPTMLPVHAPRGSGFGRRIDPFTGQWAMHEGIDFEVDVGTPVHAAAGGVVSFAAFHPQYGNLVEIDHGNDLVTRYAHLSKILVKPGDVVMRGREVGLSGATGRVTGPHLHFEVRYKDVAVNPDRFLAASDPTLPDVKGRITIPLASRVAHGD
ncbi:MAG TPA: M23 family metallopeptidase [Burkholderiales bacterium]|nr:M23 family metallopeptidase [Burkholderiales bacterium]